MTKVILNPEGEGLTRGKTKHKPGDTVDLAPNLAARLVDTGAGIYEATAAKAEAEGIDPWTGEPAKPIAPGKNAAGKDEKPADPPAPPDDAKSGDTKDAGAPTDKS